MAWLSIALAIAPGFGRAQAQRSVVPLAPTGTTLAGRLGTFERIFEFPRQAAARVKLAFQVSDLVDTRASTVSLWIDDSPVKSVRISSMPTAGGLRTLSTKLPSVPAGYHRLRVVSKLSVPGDPCLNEFEDEAWLRMNDESAVSWASVSVGVPERSLRSLGPYLAASSGLRVDVRFPPSNSAGLSQAVMGVDHWMRDVQAIGGTDSPGLTWVLTTLSQLQDTPVHPALVERLRASPLLRAGAHLAGREVHVIGTDGASLASMIELLRTPTSAQLCDVRECYAGAFRAVDRSVGETVHPTGRLQVLSLAQRGYADGWVARGPGRHTLRFAWLRPPNFEVRHIPTLGLDLRLPERGPLDLDNSGLTVTLNSVPLAGYTLDRVENNLEHLEVAVPQEYWSADSWNFEVEFQLRGHPGAPCTRAADEQIWAVVGPRSGLNVPRDELRRHTIAAAYAHTRGRSLKLLQQSPVGHGLLRVAIEVAHAFRQPDGLAASIVEDPSLCGPVCLHLRPGWPPFLGRQADGLAVPLASGEALMIPALRQTPLAVLTRVQSSDPSPHELHLWALDNLPDRGAALSAASLYARGAPTAPTPPLASMDTATALRVEAGWEAVGGKGPLSVELAKIRNEVSAEQAAPRTSAQERMWIQLNLLWLLLSAALVVVGIWRFWKSKFNGGRLRAQ